MFQSINWLDLLDVGHGSDYWMKHVVSTVVRIPHPGSMPPTVLNGIPPQEILNDEARNYIHDDLPVDAAAEVAVADPADVAHGVDANQEVDANLIVDVDHVDNVEPEDAAGAEGPDEAPPFEVDDADANVDHADDVPVFDPVVENQLIVEVGADLAIPIIPEVSFIPSNHFSLGILMSIRSLQSSHGQMNGLH